MVSSTYQCHNREPTRLLGGGNEKAQGGKLALKKRVIPILSLKCVSIKRFGTVSLFLYF